MGDVSTAGDVPLTSAIVASNTSSGHSFNFIVSRHV